MAIHRAVEVDTVGVRQALRQQVLLRTGSKGAVVEYEVSFEAPYAIYVHENLEAYHAPPTRAKFLEESARTQARTIGLKLRNWVQRGLTMTQALYQAANELLRMAVKIVPVETGFLRDSGRVRRKL